MYWDDEMHVDVVRHNRRWWRGEGLRAINTIATAAVVLVWTDSMVLAAFSALAMSYALNTVMAERLGGAWWARASVAACAVGAAVLTLDLTVSAWGRSWEAAVVSMAVGGVVHIIAGRFLAPGFITRQQQEHEREWVLDSGSHAAWNGWRKRSPHQHV